MRSRRRAFPPDLQRLAAKNLRNQLVRLSLFRNSRRIAFYHPNDGEIDPLPTLWSAWKFSKTCYLPILYRARTRRVLFGEFGPCTRMRQNRLRIWEPLVRVRDWVDPMQLDLILVPLVAFDEFGNRIGMGGGYYDQSLGYLNNRKHWRRPRIVGVAHEFQRVDRIKTDKWDVQLDAIVTDQRCYGTA